LLNVVVLDDKNTGLGKVCARFIRGVLESLSHTKSRVL
jgi:CRISPR/Cas system-associated protein Csm6